MSIAIQDVIDLGRVDIIRLACDKFAARPENNGIDPLGLYCLHTGTRIGTLDNHAVWSLAQVLETDDLSEASLVNAVIDSTMLAMRPSPAWTIQTTERLRKLIKRDPVGACVFYLSRAYHQNNAKAMKRAKGTGSGYMTHCWTSRFSHAEWNWERVNLNAYLRQNYSANALLDIAELMLETDAKIGVHKITPPTEFIDSLLAQGQIKRLTIHYRKALDQYHARKAESRPDGATQSRLIFNSYETRIHRPTKAAVKAKAKQQKYNAIDAVFQSLMEFDSQAAVAENRKDDFIPTDAAKANARAIVQAAPKPVKLMRLKGGLKLKGLGS